MHFSSIPALIDAHVLSLLGGAPLKGAALFLYVSGKNPLAVEDSNKVRALASEDDLEAYFQSYDKIDVESNISLDNVAINLEFGRAHALSKVEIASKKVIVSIGSGKEKELKNFELRLVVSKVDGEIPLAVSTYNYLRRIERQELAKKHYKPSKTDLLAFTQRHATEEQGQASTLDSESISLLRDLLPFTDKEELFKVLLKKPLKERESKKAVRLSIIPTDIEEGEEFEIRKKAFNRNTILELLS